jgi:hypothetical protein
MMTKRLLLLAILALSCAAFGQAGTPSNVAGNGGSGAFAGGAAATSFQDVTEIAAPANPAAGVERIYSDSTTHVLTCLKSSGASCLTAAGTVTSVSGTANQISVATGTTTPVLSIPSAFVLPGTINKLTLTAPATGSTLTIADGKTLTASNTLTFTGTDASSVALGTGGTVAYTGIDINSSFQITALHLAGPTLCSAANYARGIDTSGNATGCTAAPAGTVTNTGGNLTANAVVLGAGGADTAVSTGITSNGVAELDLGVAGTNGVLGLKGTTSGTAKFTAPAVAGTSTNAVVMTNVLSAPVGASGTPAYGGPNAGQGIYFLGTSTVIQGANAGGILYFGTAGNTPWDLSGNTLQATGTTGIIKPALYTSLSNCQLGGASGTTSPAACTAAPAGKIAIPASQTTYTVNTTAVTANSQIFVQQTADNSGLPSSPTCSTTVDAPLQSASVAATSFTFTMTSVASVMCYDYWIVN